MGVEPAPGYLPRNGLGMERGVRTPRHPTFSGPCQKPDFSAPRNQSAALWIQREGGIFAV